jgi:hypothetical protein
VLLLSCAAVAGVVVLGGGAALASSGDGIPKGTTVRGLDVGGLSRSAAVTRLEKAFTAERTSSITLVADDAMLQLDPVRAGIDLDAEATVDEALEVGLVGRVLSQLGAGRDVDPVPAYDDAKLRAELQRLATTFDREPREGAVRFTPEGVPVEAKPLSGRELDVDGAVAALRSSYLSQRVEVPADVRPVKTTEEGVRRARDEIAVPAVAAPVTVDVAGDALRVEPIDIAKALRLEPDADGDIEPKILADVLHDRVEGRLRTVGTPAVDAPSTSARARPSWCRRRPACRSRRTTWPRP